MKFVVTGFGGMRPRVDPQKLEDWQSTEAINCKLWSGSLRAYASVKDLGITLYKSGSGTVNSLFRFNVSPSDADDAGIFFHWLGIADAVRGVVAGDSKWTTVITGDSLAPRITDNTMNGGPDYPTNWEPLGLPVPDVSGATATVGGTPDVGSDPLKDSVRRDYVVAFVNARSQLGPTSLPIHPDADWLPGQYVDLAGLPTAPMGGYNVTSKRIYRLGETGETRYFVAEISAAATTFHDDVDEIALGEAESSAGWELPPATMHSIGVMSNGIGYGAFRNQVCVSVPGQIHAWDPLNRETLNFDIVGIGNYGTTIVALTGENPYLVYGFDSGEMRQTKLNISQGALAKLGIVSGAFGVVYPSKDGLVLISSGQPSVMTSPFFTKDEWLALKPESFRGAIYADRYFAFFDNGTTQGALIIDPSNTDAGVVFSDVFGTALYSDPIARALYLVQAGKVMQWDAGPDLLTYSWQSKEFVTTYDCGIHWGRVLADSYDDLSIEVSVDGVVRETRTVTSRKPFALAGTEGIKGRVFQFRLFGTDTVTEAAIASNAKEFR